MAKAWKEVIASPQYQALAPEQKAAAQEQYFNDVVAPQAGSQAETAKQQFYSAYPSAVTQQQQPDTMWQEQQQSPQGSAWGDRQPQTRAEEIGNSAIEAGKGVLQSGVNVANIPAEVLDAFQSAGAWAAGKLGFSDGTYQPALRIQLPEQLQPQDSYAKLGAEIGPYLIPGIGAERTAAALGSVANAGRAERLATQTGNILAENAPGVLAQNSQQNDAGSLAEDLAVGALGSVAGRGLVRGAGAVADRIGDGVRGVQDWARSLSPQSAEVVPPPRSADDVAQTVGAATDRSTADRMAVAAREVEPRQEVIDAAKSLGINQDDLLLSHVSGNQSYREFEQALKSVPGSQLAAQESAVVNRVAKLGSELADTAGALPDKAAMSDKFLSAFNRGIDTVQTKADGLYNKIAAKVPKNQTVSADNIIRHLDQKADELGGAEFLSAMEKKVYNAVSPVARAGETATPPTYARLDNIRKQVGQAIGKNTGPFRDEETGALKQLYRNLTEDQEGVVRAAGLGEQWDLAKKLVGVRTTMEDSLTGLLGKDLRGDIGTKASLAIRNLSKGDAKGFRALQQDIPSQRIRKEVIATSLRDAMSMGSRKENEFHLPGFVDWYQGMKSSGTLPMLQKELGAQASERMQNLFTLSQAIRQAQSSSITTGRLNAFIKQFDSSDGVLNKVYRHGKGALATSIIGQIPVVGPTLSYGAVAGMAAREAGRPARSVAADKFLSSPEFRQVVQKSIGQRVAPGAEAAKNRAMDRIIGKSSSWKRLYRTLTAEEKSAIARVGIIGWLSGEADGGDY